MTAPTDASAPGAGTGADGTGTAGVVGGGPTGWPSYDPSPHYDELVGPGGRPRPAAEALWRHLARLGPEALAERQSAADREIRAIGVTFTVYDEGRRRRPAVAVRHHPEDHPP